MTRNRWIKKNYKYVDYELMSKILGKTIKDFREAKGVTINMVSHYSGVNRNTIRRLENGECEKGVMLQNLVKIAVALDISMKDMVAEVDYFCNHGVLSNGMDENSLAKGEYRSA